LYTENQKGQKNLVSQYGMAERERIRRNQAIAYAIRKLLSGGRQQRQLELAASKIERMPVDQLLLSIAKASAAFVSSSEWVF
jgi:hypothetical protein